VNETLVDVLRNVLVGAGVFVALAAVARGVPVRMAVGAGLEFWLAGGLVKLSEALISWQSIAAVAALITVRKIAVIAFSSTPTFSR
jgi:hypothetical protein